MTLWAWKVSRAFKKRAPGFLKNGHHFPREQKFHDVKDVLIYWDIPDC